LLEYLLDPARLSVTLYAAPIREVPNVDDQEPPQLQPRQAALSERPDRRGVGAYQAVDPSGQARRGKRRVDMREVVNGVMYILSTACQ